MFSRRFVTHGTALELMGRVALEKGFGASQEGVYLPGTWGWREGLEGGAFGGTPWIPLLGVGGRGTGANGAAFGCEGRHEAMKEAFEARFEG